MKLAELNRRLQDFLFPAVSDKWLTLFRVGLGIQVTAYSLSICGDWNDLFRGNNGGIISRDLSEAILTAQSALVPRLGWLVDVGQHFGLSEQTVLSATWVVMLCAGLLLMVGFLSRTAAVTAWFIHLCAIKSGDVMTYGMDNFTTIGLFYLMLAPLPDRLALDWRIWKPRAKDRHLHGFFQRVLQLHLCVIYFSGGLAKSMGAAWWNGTSMWRALTCPPYNVISSDTLIAFRYLFPLLGISVCVLETGYPIFIWLKKTRRAWLIGILAMHLGIAFAMGLYLFSLIMIVLNVAAFGADLLFPERATTSRLGEADTTA